MSTDPESPEPATVVITPPSIVEPESVSCIETLQAAVGGYVQEIPEFVMYKGRACTAFADEEGHMKRLPFNHAATVAWRECLDATGMPYRLDMAVLVGDVAVVYRKVK